jgi:hypothetical protein
MKSNLLVTPNYARTVLEKLKTQYVLDLGAHLFHACVPTADSTVPSTHIASRVHKKHWLVLQSLKVDSLLSMVA